LVVIGDVVRRGHRPGAARLSIGSGREPGNALRHHTTPSAPAAAPAATIHRMWSLVRQTTTALAAAAATTRHPPVCDTMIQLVAPRSAIVMGAIAARNARTARERPRDVPHRPTATASIDDGRRIASCANAAPMTPAAWYPTSAT